MVSTGASMAIGYAIGSSGGGGGGASICAQNLSAVGCEAYKASVDAVNTPIQSLVVVVAVVVAFVYIMEYNLIGKFMSFVKKLFK